MTSSVPAGLNIPRAVIRLVAAAGWLAGGALGFFLLSFALAGDPDFSFDREQLVWVGAPLGLALFCHRLLRAHADRLAAAGRSVAASAGAVLWLGNLLLASVLGFYFLDDASVAPAQYGDVLLSRGALLLLAAVSFAVVYASVWAIARSLPALLALPLTVALCVALHLSEASSSWLGL
jgi:hypothetical protein